MIWYSGSTVILKSTHVLARTFEHNDITMKVSVMPSYFKIIFITLFTLSYIISRWHKESISELYHHGSSMLLIYPVNESIIVKEVDITIPRSSLSILPTY